jgi:hypothetical protein
VKDGFPSEQRTSTDTVVEPENVIVVPNQVDRSLAA